MRLYYNIGTAKKRKNYMKIQLIIVELVIWIVILFAGGWYVYTSIIPDQFNESYITVNFGDIDGLEEGAPVNFMGVPIGSVKHFEVNDHDEKVLVTFEIKDKAYEIPSGSIATIQFTGLVGSKSLEIEPPRNPSLVPPDKGIITQNPIRISSYIQMAANTSESIAGGSKNFLKMFGEGTIEKIKRNIRRVHILSYASIDGSEKAKDVLSKATQEIISALGDINSALDSSIVSSERIVSSMNSRDYDEDTKAIFRVAKYTLIYFYQNLRESNYQRDLKDLIDAGQSLNRRLYRKNFEYFLNINTGSLLARVQNFNNKLDKSVTLFDNWAVKIQNLEEQNIFKKILDKTMVIKEITLKLEQRI